MEDKVANPSHRPPRVFTGEEIAECKDLSDVLSQKQLAMYLVALPIRYVRPLKDSQSFLRRIGRGRRLELPRSLNHWLRRLLTAMLQQPSSTYLTKQDGQKPRGRR